MTDRGSITPLVLGFAIVALLTVAGAVAAGDAFVQQRGIQAACDAAAAAAAADAAELDRSAAVGAGNALRLADVTTAVRRYLARDPARTQLRIAASVSPDATTVSLTCTETASVAFGRVFGKAGGVRHVVHASARAPLS